MAFPNGCSNVRHIKPAEQPSRFFADAARSIVLTVPFKLVDNANYAAPQLCAFARLHQPLAVGLVTQSRVGVKAHKHRANYLVVRKPERRILHATCIESLANHLHAHRMERRESHRGTKRHHLLGLEQPGWCLLCPRARHGPKPANRSRTDRSRAAFDDRKDLC